MKKFAIVVIMLLMCALTFCACVNSDPLETQKSDAIAQINSLVSEKKNSDKYSHSNWDVMDTFASEAKTAIFDATSAQAINEIKQEAIDKINSILTAIEEKAEQLLQQGKNNAKWQLENSLSYYSEDDYSEENWQKVMAIYNQKIEIVDEVTDGAIFTNKYISDLSTDFMFESYVIDKLADKYATVYFEMDATTEEYSIRYRFSHGSYSYDTWYFERSDAKDIHEILANPPTKEGYFFAGWINSSLAPYDFNIIFSALNPQAIYVVKTLFIELPTVAIVGIDEVIGTWTGEYVSKNIIFEGENYQVIANATITIDEFGMVLIERQYRVDGISDELAEQFIEAGSYTTSDTLNMLIEYESTNNDGSINYTEVCYDYDSWISMYPNASKSYNIWLGGDVLKFSGHSLTKV